MSQEISQSFLNELKELAKKTITDLKTKFSVSAEYFAATNPVAILELIAEIEKLRAKDGVQSVACDECKEVEAELKYKNERLEKEVDWLAYQLADDSIIDPPCGVDCNPCELGCRQEKWIEAARKAAENQ